MTNINTQYNNQQTGDFSKYKHYTEKVSDIYDILMSTTNNYGMRCYKYIKALSRNVIKMTMPYIFPCSA